MTSRAYKHLYGPVPSRRLGRSLGVDLVPYKVCSYDCVYCQLGRTTKKTVSRKEYVPVGSLLAELEARLAQPDRPDYISLAGSGEPTLNSRIGYVIRGIKNLSDVPVAVLTNGSLLWMEEVQEDLMQADLVIPSLDAGDAQLFRSVNRPHSGVSFARMVEGLEIFTARFPGKVWLEVFLLAGVTGIEAEAKKIASLVGRIRLARVQLNTVTRPPAEHFASALGAEQMSAMKGFFPGEVEVIGAGRASGSSDAWRSTATDAEILAMLGRRPCTCHDVARGLGIHPNEAVKHLDALVAVGKLRVAMTGGKPYYTTNNEGDSRR